MKRALNITLELLGILILGLLATTFALALRWQSGGVGQAIQPYPIASQASPITPPVTIYPKPSPPTPPATIPPEPSLPIELTVAPLPYPPPESPTPPNIPTSNPSITSPAPTIVPTASEPLPQGMKIVYGETDGSAGTTAIWIANVTLEWRRQLVAVTHKAGYTIEGAVSPDGSKIAYLIISPQAGEQLARTAGGELWVMGTDGTHPRPIAYQVGHLGMWSPDGTTITFSRLVMLEKPHDPQVPFRTGLYSVDVNSTDTKLLLADDKAYGVQPVGWSPEGDLFYYAAVTLQGQWELWTMDVTNRVTRLQTRLPYPIIQNLLLSPDRKNLLLLALNDKGQHVLAVVSIDGQQTEVIASGTTGDQPVDQYAAVWSPDSKDILAYIPPNAEQGGQLERVDLASSKAQSLLVEPVDGSGFFIPYSWSPDGNWVILLQYPHPQSLAYLLGVTGGSMVQIPLTLPSNWVTVLGWTDQGK